MKKRKAAAVLLKGTYQKTINILTKTGKNKEVGIISELDQSYLVEEYNNNRLENQQNHRF